MKTTTECPNHGGSFDCTPFCHICEGNQEYESDGTLPCHRFATCGTMVEEDIWREESGFCQPCQSLYYEHKLDPYTLEEIVLECEGEHEWIGSPLYCSACGVDKGNEEQ